VGCVWRQVERAGVGRALAETWRWGRRSGAFLSAFRHMGERERQSRLALNARLVSHPMFDGGCRDPRWASPTTARLEAAWDNTNPSWTNYIPNLGTPRHYAAIDQIEEHVKRPITSDGWRVARKLEDRPRAAAPPTHRKKVSPTIFTNSMTWNRRHCKSLWCLVVPRLLRFRLVPGPRLHDLLVYFLIHGLVVSDEPTVTQHPWKAAPRSSWYSPRTARSSHSERRRLSPDSACGPGFAGPGSGLPPLTKRSKLQMPQPSAKEVCDAEPEPEPLQPEPPQPEPEPEPAPRSQPSPDSIIAFKAAGHSMKPYRKGWVLHKQHEHADKAYEAIGALQEQMMDKIQSGCITPEELEEFKKLMAELSSSIEG
jgi:hypothetical protein